MVAPVLVPGCDDIYWMNHLHGALASQGYFPGDEEMESWLFADQTQSALLTFQVPSGLQALRFCCNQNLVLVSPEERRKPGIEVRIEQSVQESLAGRWGTERYAIRTASPGAHFVRRDR